MTVSVRAATVSDRTACLALLDSLAATTGGTIHAGAADTFDVLLQTQRGKILVAEDDGVILGLASVSFNLAMRYGGEYCQLEELIVDPRARGKNIGGLLVAATVAEAEARGCGEYGLYLVAATEGNRAFYEKYGFRVVGSELRQRLGES